MWGGEEKTPVRGWNSLSREFVEKEPRQAQQELAGNKLWTKRRSL